MASEVYGRVVLWAAVVLAAFILIRAVLQPKRLLPAPGAVSLPPPALPEFQEWLVT